MIPILMIPVLNRQDLMQRLILSIDHPVQILLIVNNGELDLKFDRPDVIERVVIFTPPLSPIGYGGAINYAITQTPQHRWWMWASNDVEFHPGYLDTVVRQMDEATGPRIITGGFTWAAANAELIEQVGLVDDWSFFPIYFDDNDYYYRCQLAKVEWIEDGEMGTTHGDERDHGSVTIRSDQAVNAANNRSYVLNAQAYVAKWGGPPGNERFTTPWNEGHPLWVTRPDMAGRTRRRW